MMHFIKGLQKTSLVDYPGKVCATIFTAKCDFRCGFCHNKELVLDYEQLPEIKEGEILDFLKQRKKWIDGVCISGGEPCLHGKKLVDLIKKIKAIGLLVKLDTNGSCPDLIEEMINKKLIDYVAMDIKGPLEKYDKIAGVKVNKEKIQKSIDLIKNSNVNYEFRTTVIPNLLKKEDIIEIGEWLKGAKKYCIQNFKPTKNRLIEKKFEEIKPYDEKDLAEMRDLIKKNFEIVEIRNI